MLGYRIVFRIVQKKEAVARDFMSAKELGLPPSREHPELWDGVSVWNTLRQAQNKAKDYPFLGSYVVKLSLDLTRVRIEKTLPRSPGHHTAWADAVTLFSFVIDTEAV
jgi:hypothetical protein